MLLSGSYGNGCVFVSKCHDFRPGLRSSVIKIAPLGLVLRFYISFLKQDFCNLVSEEQSTQVLGKVIQNKLLTFKLIEASLKLIEA